ncbi:metallophosphoesterase [Aliiglaciecola sp. CAU 1673]|uniref:metallophosphoesterase family protein n=1 Tax=Aliiglaciecola sp. CAU 1673 TaxID=3032595 RepID=UPI0023DC94E1|nr:metallophosphoesterase [Aliiglaciecola sp. CAU 1673]MDF2180384.1 metallophosphoesterase [Aliiglaciecola sp. CAU 1673]
MLLRLAQVSDCHLFADPDRLGYGNINPYQSLQRVLAEVAKVQPDRVIFTGDISGDLSEQSYQHFVQLWQQSGMDIPWHIIPGNHDAPNLMQALFTEQLLWLKHPIQHGNWRLHALNSHYIGTLGMVDDKQLKAFEKKLDSEPDASHLIAVHHHPLPTHSWMDRHEWVNRELFLQLIAGRHQVKVVIHGHIHSDQQQLFERAQILACPSSCWQWQLSSDFAVADEAPGFRLIHLAADGSCSTDVMRLAGEN